jgi:hypothetical protein
LRMDFAQGSNSMSPMLEAERGTAWTKAPNTEKKEKPISRIRCRLDRKGREGPR